MIVNVDFLSKDDRKQWEVLYHGYAGFYQVPMNDEILDTVWGWIQDAGNPFFGLVAKDESGQALGLMHCRQMPSPLRGALVGFLDDLFVFGVARAIPPLIRVCNDSVDIFTPENIPPSTFMPLAFQKRVSALMMAI